MVEKRLYGVEKQFENVEKSLISIENKMNDMIVRSNSLATKDDFAMFEMNINNALLKGFESK